MSSILCLGGISWLSFEIVTDVKAKRAQSDEITAAPIEVAPIVEENAPILDCETNKDKDQVKQLMEFLER